MSHSLQFRLTLTYIAVIAVAVLAMTVIMRWTVGARFTDYMQALQARQAQILAERVATEYAHNRDWSVVRPLLESWGTVSRNTVNLLGPDGQVIVTGPPGRALSIAPEDLRRALQGEIVQGLSGQDDDGDALSHTAVPVVVDGTPVAVLYLQISPERRKPSRRSFNQLLNEALAVAGLLAVVVAVVFGAAFARRITRPIQEMKRVAERMAEGDYAQRVSNPGKDEVGQLAASFNHMAATLERDVSELKRQEQFRREMVANISHDLSTPLTAIQGFSEALRDGVIRSPEEQHELLETINKEALRLRRLVHDLQDLSQIESGQPRIERRPLHLPGLLEETLKVVQPEVQQQRLHVTSQVDPELPLALADEDRTTQVLLNLLDNAIRYTPQGGQVHVQAQRQNGCIRVAVRNSGPPIPAEALPRIFERFYRADQSRNKETGNSGLGLAIVKAIVEAQGGQVVVTSSADEGTEVAFTVPLCER